MTLIGGLLALVVGFVLGLLGGGGSVLTVPILIYALHVPVKPAIAMSLVVVGLVAFIGFIGHARQGTVSKRAALIFAPPAVAAAYAGARIARRARFGRMAAGPRSPGGLRAVALGRGAQPEPPAALVAVQQPQASRLGACSSACAAPRPACRWAGCSPRP